VIDHINIGDNVMAAARTGITKDVPPNSVIGGFPNLDIKEWRKSAAMLPRLYELAKEVKRLKKKVEELEQKIKESGKKLQG
jgi:UDP-3-O-[3-hydroxymyristoyl] glucosamine N-acyltransferase